MSAAHVAVHDLVEGLDPAESSAGQVAPEPLRLLQTLLVQLEPRGLIQRSLLLARSPRTAQAASDSPRTARAAWLDPAESSAGQVAPEPLRLLQTLLVQLEPRGSRSLRTTELQRAHTQSKARAGAVAR